jgi:serine/threonine-protein kinase
VKFLRAELAGDDKTVARFLQERQIFRRLDHPNVVRVIDLVAEGDDLAIVMERVSGGDLKERIQSGSLSPVQAIEVAAGIAAGIGAIHEASVIHRDLKPANILITDDLVPKISDFGISKLVSDAMTRTSVTIGTPLYMAPEAADKRGAGAPSDVYALGIILFEMLIGRCPFTDGGTFAIIRAHAMDAPPRIGGVPDALADLIDAMLAKEPTDRPAVDEVRRVLDEVLAGLSGDVLPGDVSPGDVLPDGVSPGDTASNGASPDRVGAASLAPVVVARAGVDDPTMPYTGVDADGPATDAGGAAVVVDPEATAIDPNATRAMLRDGPAGSAAVAGSAAAESSAASAAGSAANQTRALEQPQPPPQQTPPEPPAVVPPSAGAPPPTEQPGGSFLVDRRPRRLWEIGGAVASVVVLIAVGLFLLNRDGGDPTVGGTTSTVSTTTPTTEPTTPTTPVGPTTTEPSTSTSEPTQSSTSTSTSESTTTTEESTTTSESTTSSSTTSSTVAATQIVIVDGPTVNVRNPTSFQFSYFTNNVCGTGSFQVIKVDTNETVGSYKGDDICFGPEHGGFPGLDGNPVFGDINIEPATTYQVLVTVAGTETDGSKPSGTGTDSASFLVNTPAA